MNDVTTILPSGRNIDAELRRAAKGKAETSEHLFTRPDLIRSKSSVTHFGVGHNAAATTVICGYNKYEIKL